MIVLGIGHRPIVDQLICIYCGMKSCMYGYYCLFCIRLPMHFQKNCVFKFFIDIFYELKKKQMIFFYSGFLKQHNFHYIFIFRKNFQYYTLAYKEISSYFIQNVFFLICKNIDKDLNNIIILTLSA